MDSKTGAADPSWMLNATDNALSEAMQTGQVEALREIYRRYGRLVYSLALRILSTPEEAEDLTQEIFLKLWQKSGYNVDRGSLGTYLTLVTRSRAIDRVRSRGARYRLMQRWDTAHTAAAPTNLPLEKATWGEQAQRVREALAELSAPEREVLEIAYYEGLSQSQIAHRLEIPLGTVKTRSRQALKKLRFKLQDLI
ncbi:MAG: sigma-70 family RNA polymerase sigma factor [Leptolyngbya sp. SIO1E4]|nr:sigma-70 family RNA polymerase sigma factor [Leptolyngbya sp. SIO1E4]